MRPSNAFGGVRLSVDAEFEAIARHLNANAGHEPGEQTGRPPVSRLAWWDDCTIGALGRVLINPPFRSRR